MSTRQGGLNIHQMEARFSLGRILVDRESYHTLDRNDIDAALSRHCSGDWGALVGPDRTKNEQLLVEKGTVHSEFIDQKGRRFLVWTDLRASLTSVRLVQSETEQPSIQTDNESK